MSECKATVVVEICAETAVDAVSKRTAKGMKVATACKEVAEEFNKENEAEIKWQSLRKSYNRANNAATKKEGHVPVSKEGHVPVSKEGHVPVSKEGHVAKLDVPMATATTIDDNTTIEEANIVIDMFMALQKRYDVLDKQLTDLVMQEAGVPVVKEEKKDGVLPREEAVEFVIKEGNQIQCTMIKTQNPDNERLFNLFAAVRSRYLESNPPQSLPEVIRNATRIEL